jgi:hypothetical protein
LHERLIDDEVQRGRRILTHQVHSSEEIEKLVRERGRDYEMVSRTLSMLDVAALYVERGYIDKQLFMEEWGPGPIGARRDLGIYKDETERGPLAFVINLFSKSSAHWM